MKLSNTFRPALDAVLPTPTSIAPAVGRSVWPPDAPVAGVRRTGVPCLRVATPEDREIIYRMRHKVYARELAQHAVNADEILRDPLDRYNCYLVAEIAGEIAGFISVTPPERGPYSLDKYVARSELPFVFDEGLFEVRLLTVDPGNRGQRLAGILMYAAFRWVEAHGGTRIMAIGRREILGLYRKAGLMPVGIAVQSGAVAYEVLQSPVEALRGRLNDLHKLLARIGSGLNWQLPVAFLKPADCFHGGAFYQAIGEDLQTLERRHDVINADVLDAWFPPSPRVNAALQADLPWIVRTSPPTDCGGLTRAIAKARGVRPASILPGAGSSDLIFRAFRQWLRPESRALILDPTYGEYAHVLEQVIGCEVERMTLNRANDYQLSVEELSRRLVEEWDLVVLVNPNSPTGQYLNRAPLEDCLRRVPASTRVWIDETYIDYAGAGESLESVAARSANIVVCKSMSKVYALSGVRAAYLCASPHQLESLRAVTPPWVIGLPGQIAAVQALLDPDYYAARYAETHELREALSERLRAMGLDVIPGCANFVLAHLPPTGPDAAEVVSRCRRQGLFLRDAGRTSVVLGTHTIRVAVKDAATNARMIELIGRTFS